MTGTSQIDPSTSTAEKEFVQDGKRVDVVLTALRSEGLRLTTSMGERLQRGRDSSYLKPRPADIVVFATSTGDVSAIARICDRHDMPFLAFGAGTSGCGHLMALAGGVCIDLTAMNAVLDVSQDDFHCTVQAGVVRQELNKFLRDTGLFFPIDACAEASIGGMCSTRASGTNAVRYGTMRENVVSLEVVLVDGTVIRTGSLARKSAAGYDLTRLFVGAGGTLGIITEATIRLHPIPEHAIAATCSFSTVTEAARAVLDLLKYGHQVGKVEIVDAQMVGMINRYSGLALAEEPYLFFDFTGTEASIEETAAIARDVCAENGGRTFEFAREPEKRSKLWEARHAAGWAVLASRPGASVFSTDITVPVSRLAEAIEDARRELEGLPFPSPILGHVGDGNFHICFMIDPASEEEMRVVNEVHDRLLRNAIAMGGTCTGEHGVGYAKNRWMVEEYGEAGLGVMRSIKNALDPKGLLNPGKIFDLVEKDS